MSRRSGQNPSVRTRFNRTKGRQEYFFQYWTDVPGEEERKRETEVLGPIDSMTKSEAERKKCKRLVKAVSTAARDVDMIALVDTFLVSTR